MRTRMSEQPRLFEQKPTGNKRKAGRKMRVWVRKGSTPEQFRRQIEAALACFGPMKGKGHDGKRQ